MNRMDWTEMNADTIYVYIQTYELREKYLIRALDSIRKQTYTNFRCLVYDNCSGEAVRARLQEYVEEDKRFSLTYFDNTAGHTIAWEYGIPEILRLAGDKGGYYFRLDADDELALDCFEKMHTYMTENNLDMAASAAFFVDAETQKVVGLRGSQTSFILEGDAFDSRLPEYYQLMRTHWGKLYSLDVMSKMNLSNLKITTYGGDTLFVREALLKAKRVGILSDPLYKYYIYADVRGYNLEKGRTEAPRLLLERDVSFLLQKCGKISVGTTAWLIDIYLQENGDVFRLVASSDTDNQQKIEAAYSVLASIPSRLAIRLGARKAYEQLAGWLLEQNILENAETEGRAAEMFGILKMLPEQIPNAGNADYFRFVMKMYDFWDDYSTKSFVEDRIVKCVQNSLLLQDTDFYYCRFNKGIVEAVLREDYREAYRAIKEAVQKRHYFDGQFIRKHIELGQNIAAVLEDEAEFVYMNKQRIQQLMEDNPQEALAEVNEWLEILPDDTELNEFKRRIGEKKGTR